MLFIRSVIERLGYPVEVAAGKYITHFTDKAVTIYDEDCELLTVTAIDDATVTATPLNVAAAKTPLLIFNSSDKTKELWIIPIEEATEEFTPDEVEVAPEFKGTLEEKTFTEAEMSAAEHFICNGDAFIWVRSEGTIDAKKCWLELSNDKPLSARTIVISGRETTAMGAWSQATETYDFDDSTMQGWTTIDADGDGFTWMLGSEVGGIYLDNGADLSGTGHNSSADFVTSGSYSNVYGALYPDNYLVSPKVRLGGEITFWACGQDASYVAEYFGIAVSTAGNTDPADFTMLQQWTMTASRQLAPRRAQGNWYQYTVDLSEYKGKEGYVAIRHYNCSDMFLLNIDDIEIIPGEGYQLVAGTTEHGTMTFLVDGEEVEEAVPGAEVTVVVTPEEGWISSSVIARPFSSWEVAAARGEAQDIEIIQPINATKAALRNQWTFTMPANDVEVSVNYIDTDDVIELLRQETELSKMLFRSYGDTKDEELLKEMIKVIGQANSLLKKYDSGQDVSLDEAQNLLEQLQALNANFADVVTGISLTPTLSEGEGVWYDLQGRRVAQPTKGLYIKNGKVVVVK